MERRAMGGIFVSFIIENDFDGVKNLMVKEQYLESCPAAVFLRERKPRDLNELARIAEQYMEAHAGRGLAR